MGSTTVLPSSLLPRRCATADLHSCAPRVGIHPACMANPSAAKKPASPSSVRGGEPPAKRIRGAGEPRLQAAVNIGNKNRPSSVRGPDPPAKRARVVDDPRLSAVVTIGSKKRPSSIRGGDPPAKGVRAVTEPHLAAAADNIGIKKRPCPSSDRDPKRSTRLNAAAIKNRSQAPLLLPEDESSQAMLGNNKNGMKACLPIPPCPCPGNKKRKNRPPSTEDDDFEEPSPRSSKRAMDEMEELPSPRATNQIMASCLLKRRHGATGPSETEGQTIICCLCKELPGDSPCCPLHQNVRFWSWMLEMGDGEIPTAGSGDGVVVPTRRTESKKTVLTYMRWRSRVWMPSRFYLERACPGGDGATGVAGPLVK